MPDQTGKIAIVTGGNTGIGYETALALYEAGAHVIIACRDAERATEAIDTMKSTGGKGSLEFGLLNLANLGAIKSFAEYFKQKHQRLNMLINNAGVMMPPASKTDDGFELQFGVNFIGHFALTAHLYPVLKSTAHCRVVSVSSGASTFVDHIDYDNLKLEKPYEEMREYATSKLANVYFASELQRRAQPFSNLMSNAVHPGVVYTELQRHIPKDQLEIAFSKYKKVSDPWQGALPSLFAATSPSASGGAYYGPDGENEQSGYPALSQRITPAMKDESKAAELWNYAEEVTGLKFPY